MKYFFLLLLVSFFIIPSLSAQTIPYGQCGLQYTYDAAGNLISREYFCNNMPDGGRTGNPVKTDSNFQKLETINGAHTIVQQIEALYPNPTTGRFNVSLVQAMENATVRIIDLNARVLQQFKMSGTLIQCDISTLPSGVYYILIVDKNGTISKKIIKQ